MTKVKDESVVKTKSESECILKKKVVKEAISVLKQLNQKFSEGQSKKPLLDDDSGSPVYLQITLKKIPPKKLKCFIKVNLPHPLLTETTEVCLITGDLDKNNKKDEIEPTVLHYKNLLKKHDISSIAEVVPLRQLRTEYKTFESKRQLSDAYDVFLSDRKISHCLPKVLGKAFYDKRKFPIQINMDTPNLKEQVEKAVSLTKFSLACRGNSCTSEIAHLSMEDADILENILTCIKTLEDKIPGKWPNILGLYIKTAKSEAIPIYMSFENPNDLKVKAPRHKEKVSAEELSTVRNAEVKVFKDGRIIIKSTPDSEDEDNKGNTVDETDVKPKIKRKRTDKQNKEAELEDESEQDSENEEADLNIKKKLFKSKRNKGAKNKDDEEEIDTSVADVKPINKKRKSNKQSKVVELEDEEIQNEQEVEVNSDKKLPKSKRNKVVKDDNSGIEGKEENTTDVEDVKPKNKRKKSNKQSKVVELEEIQNEQEVEVNSNKKLPKSKRNKVVKDDNGGIEGNEENTAVVEDVKPKNKTRKSNKQNKEEVELKDEGHHDIHNEQEVNINGVKNHSKSKSNKVAKNKGNIFCDANGKVEVISLDEEEPEVNVKSLTQKKTQKRKLEEEGGQHVAAELVSDFNSNKKELRSTRSRVAKAKNTAFGKLEVNNQDEEEIAIDIESSGQKKSKKRKSKL